MLQIKAENMLLFIQRERDEIRRLWDMLYYGESERNHFTLLSQETGSEEMLEAHEQYRKHLESEIESRTPILKVVRKYYDLVEEQQQLEVTSFYHSCQLWFDFVNRLQLLIRLV